MKKLTLGLVALVATSTLVACVSSNDDNILRVSSGSDITILDSTLATDNVASGVLTNTMEGLMMLDENSQAIPGLAEPTVSDDNLTYTFKIREGVMWYNSNGEEVGEVTADDFEFAWKRLVDPATGSEYAFIMESAGVENAGGIAAGALKPDSLGVKALDSHTLEVKLSRPTPYFLDLMAFKSFYPIEKAFLDTVGDTYGTKLESTLSYGPFILTEWRNGEKWTMTKNENYYAADSIAIDAVETLVIKDMAAIVNAYEAGEIDTAGLTSDYVARYKDKPEFHTRSLTSVFYMQMNAKDETMMNQSLRNAIQHAYDKQAFCDVILGNGSTPLNGMVAGNFLFNPETMADFREDGYNVEFDVALAQEFWEIAKKELGVDKLTVTLVAEDSDTVKKMCEFIQGELQRNLPGLTIEIQQMPFKNKLANVASGDYQIAMQGWGPDYPDAMTYLDMFLSDSSQNATGFANTDFDNLIHISLEGTKAPVDRWNDLVAAEKILLESGVISPTYQRGSSYVERTYVEGIRYHTFGLEAEYKFVKLNK